MIFLPEREAATLLPGWRGISYLDRRWSKESRCADAVTLTRPAVGVLIDVRS
jgi:hypothetical protein